MHDVQDDCEYTCHNNHTRYHQWATDSTAKPSSIDVLRHCQGEHDQHSRRAISENDQHSGPPLRASFATKQSDAHRKHQDCGMKGDPVVCQSSEKAPNRKEPTGYEKHSDSNYSFRHSTSIRRTAAITRPRREIVHCQNTRLRGSGALRCYPHRIRYRYELLCPVRGLCGSISMIIPATTNAKEPPPMM